MPGRRDARRAVHLEPAVVVAGQMRLAGVEADPDPDRKAVRPRMCLDGALGVDGRGDRSAGLGKDREHGIALGPHDDAAVVIDHPAKERDVPSLTRSQSRPSSRASAIEPSTSVRRNVTVPTGRSDRSVTGR